MHTHTGRKESCNQLILGVLQQCSVCIWETIKCLSFSVIHHIIGTRETKGRQNRREGREKVVVQGNDRKREGGCVQQSGFSVQGSAFSSVHCWDPDFTGGDSGALSIFPDLLFLALYFSHRLMTKQHNETLSSGEVGRSNFFLSFQRPSQSWAKKVEKAPLLPQNL